MDTRLSKYRLPHSTAPYTACSKGIPKARRNMKLSQNSYAGADLALWFENGSFWADKI